MSSRKVASVFHRLFRKGRGGDEGAGGAGSGGGSQGSPARRLIRSHHAVTPSSPPTSAQHIYKNKQSSGGGGGGAEQQQQCSVHKSVRSKRLMKELQDIQKNQKKDSPFTVELINDNLYEWHIRLYSIDKESELYGDMAELGIRYISLQMSFPENFPFVPPFMRVISPKIEKGFVMEGGAICMELLTPRGWASAYTVEAIIMQFAASLVKGQGRISRKTKTTSKDFTKRVAEESFRSLVKTHDKYGWVTPPLADG